MVTQNQSKDLNRRGRLDNERAAVIVMQALEATLPGAEATLVPPVESLKEYGYGIELELFDGQVVQLTVWAGREEDEE